MAKPAIELTRDELLAMLQAFAAQRPGIEPGNYHTFASYRGESREVTADLHDFRALLSAVRWRESIDADTIRAALQTGGRLTLDDAGRLDYCTGQYFPTEYRKAACRVLASLLWDYARRCIAEDRAKHSGVVLYRHANAADAIRATYAREFGRRIVSRYFN